MRFRRRNSGRFRSRFLLNGRTFVNSDRDGGTNHLEGIRSGCDCSRRLAAHAVCNRCRLYGIALRGILVHPMSEERNDTPDQHYRREPGHPIAGSRMPRLALETPPCRRFVCIFGLFRLFFYQLVKIRHILNVITLNNCIFEPCTSVVHMPCGGVFGNVQLLRNLFVGETLEDEQVEHRAGDRRKLLNQAHHLL